MSKNIAIKEGGVSKTLTVDALRPKMMGGGTEDWLPADGKDLVELEIGGSGTYLASTYGAYGVSIVRVKPKYGGGATSKAVEHEFTELHTPAISEGGKAYSFTAALLKTNQQGGGECLWVPRKDVALKSKHITKSGVYAARDDDCYGFNEVTVSGVDVEITQDGDGDDVAEVTDGGVTTETKLPSSIVIETPPAKHDYVDSQSIDFSGMVVKAYTNSGQLWTDKIHPDGIIPLSELVLPVTVADVGSVTGETATSDLITEPFECGSSGKVVIGPIDSTADRWYLLSANDSDGKLTLKGTLGGASWDGIYASASPSGGVTDKLYYPGGGSRTTIHNVNQTYKHNGRTVNYATWTASYSGGSSRIKEIAPTYSSGTRGEIAWTMIFGTITQGGQNIPVQWNRPYDDELLETSFSITVS